MDSETPVLKWVAAAIGVILVCFCLGYFVLGPSARTNQPEGVSMTEATPEAAAVAPPRPGVAGAGGDNVVVEERTDEIEAKRLKAAQEAAKKKADEAAKKKAEDEAKKQAEAAAAAAAATPSPTPSPTAEATPDPNAAPNSGDPTPAPGSVGDSTAVAPAETVYRVRVGSFNSRDDAKNLATELNGRGYTAAVVTENNEGKTTFRVQVGAFRDRKTADNTQKELSANGYDATVSGR